MRTLVSDPVVFDHVEVVVVERAAEGHWALIEQHPETVELVVNPLAVVGWPVWHVVQDSSAFHLVVVEIALVVGSV